MDYGQSATMPQNPKKGDTWTPIEPHSWADLGQQIRGDHSWMPVSEYERQQQGLNLLPGSSAPPPLAPLSSLGPQWTSPEALEEESEATLRNRFIAAGMPPDLAASTAADMVFENWVENTASRVFKEIKDTGREADLEAIKEQLRKTREGAAPPEEGGIDWADLLGGGDGGAAPPIFSPQEERMLMDFKNAVAVGEMSQEQAWKRLESYWEGEAVQTRRAEEAGRRGETLLAGAFAGPYLPMTGPGGMGAALSERYDVPNLLPGVRGIPLSEARDVYGGAQAQMGLPETLPPIAPPEFELPDWRSLGEAMPTFGGRNFFEELFRRARSTAPVL